MASKSNNNHVRARQLNLNEMYNERVASQFLIQSSQQTPRLKQLEIFSYNLDSKIATQTCEIVGNDVIGKLAHVIPNQ